MALGSRIQAVENPEAGSRHVPAAWFVQTIDGEKVKAWGDSHESADASLGVARLDVLLQGASWLRPTQLRASTRQSAHPTMLAMFRSILEEV